MSDEERDTDAIIAAEEQRYATGGGSSFLQRMDATLHGKDSTRESDDAWVMTYMDLVTLLLTLFILLLAYESRSSGEFEQVTNAMAEAASKPKKRVESTVVPERLLPQPPEQDAALESMSRDLKQQLEAAGLGGSVDMQLKAQQLDIQLNEKILFSSGQARLSHDAFRALDPIVSVFSEQEYDITVEGHTDNIPIANAQFPSNWELSVARAAYVVRYLIESGIAADRLKAVGYADTRPLESNDTAEGRRTNRRVTLVIHPKEQNQPTSGESP
ncbi:MAG: OmpA/MotB family protein [Pseudomonadota bacterium]